METRELSPSFFVSAQLTKESILLAKKAGFTHIICNRPAQESSPEEKPDIIRNAAECANLVFQYIPFDPSSLTTKGLLNLENDNSHKVLAYCTSGTRSAVMWAFEMAGKIPTQDILSQIQSVGISISHLETQLENLTTKRISEG